MAFTIAATQAAATDGRWPGRGAPSVLGETSAPITVPSGRTRGVSIIKGGAIGGAGTQVWGENERTNLIYGEKDSDGSKIKKTTIINKI